MDILSYIPLTPAQIHALYDFRKVVVRTGLTKPEVVATFTTFQAQEIKVTMDKSGVIKSVTLQE